MSHGAAAVALALAGAGGAVVGAVVGGVSSYLIQRRADRDRRALWMDDFERGTLLQASDAMTELYLAITRRPPAISGSVADLEANRQAYEDYRIALMRFGTLMHRVRDDGVRRLLADVYGAAESVQESGGDPSQFARAMLMATGPLNELIRLSLGRRSH